MENNIIDKFLTYITTHGYTNNDSLFLQNLSKYLVELLDVNYIIIDKFSTDKSKIASIECFYFKKDDSFYPKIDYPLANTPCENVINKESCCYIDNVLELFPKDKILVDESITNYIGIPLWGFHNEPIGLIAIMDNSTIKNVKEIQKLLQIVALKVEKVLEKIIFDEKIENSEKNLLESQNKLFQAEKIANLGSFSLDIDGAWECNAILEKIIGVEENYKKDLEGLLNIVHPDDKETVSIDILDTINDKIDFFNKEYRIIRYSDKKVRWINTLGKILLDNQGNAFKIIGTMQDVTASKQIQQELLEAKQAAEESQLRFETIIEQAGDALYLHDLEGKIVEINKTSVISTGYSREELLSMNVKDIDAIYRELSKLKEVWAGLTIDNPVTIESFHKRKNGTIFPIEIRICAIYLNEEKFIYGFARDISERVNLNNDNKLLSAAVDQSANSIVITDIHGNIQFVNPKFTQLTGYKSEEVLGKNPRILNSGLLPKDYYKNLWDTILNGETWRGEFQNKSKSGDLIWERTTINPIKNEEGIITNFLAIKEDITEHKKSEIALNTAYSQIKENEDYLKNILQTANEGFWIINKIGITTEVNLKMCDILGYSEEEFIGKSVFDFVDEKNKEIFSEQIKLRDKGISSKYEIELIKKNGDTAICLFKTSPIFNKINERIGSFALVTDVTKLNKATNKLKKRNDELSELSIELFDKNKLISDSKNRYESIFNNSPIAILEEDFSEVLKLINKKNIDPKDLKEYLTNDKEFLFQLIEKIKILKANKSCLNLFGVKNRLELINHLRLTNNENSYIILINEIYAISTGEIEFVSETEFTNTAGESINAVIKLAIVDTQGKAISTIIDITTIKNTELELRFSKEKAEESNRLKTEFINNMSHEIRTPMNGILGFSELLNNSDLTVDKRNYFISIIQNSGKQLLNVIDDILEISRLGTKQVKVVETKVCLNDLNRELFSIFDLKTMEKGVHLYVKNELSDADSTIYTDKTKLQKIISNLLENAIKFTNKGFVKFGYQLVEDTLEIFVNDTGIGIKPEKQQVIFERFSQEEKDYSRNASGLGLGLSIAKENTELIGGKISVESIKWQGATFWVKIPYKRVNEPLGDDQITIKDQLEKLKYKVLIVEDEEVNFLFIEILLQDKINLNCDVLHATNGKEAVEMYTKNKDIDFILMDINMPIMNGYLATEEIKKINPNVPIIAQTAYSTPEDKAKALGAGCDDFISKPINKDLLKSIIDSFIVEKI